MDGTQKPKLIRNCRLQSSPIQGEVLLMPEGVLKLKGTGAAILGLCDGERSLSEIISALKSRFSSADPKQIESEATTFLNTLRDKRVVDF